MKKVLITIFLFISSFFLFGLKDVYAESYTRTITEADLNVVTARDIRLFLDYLSLYIKNDTEKYDRQ